MAQRKGGSVAPAKQKLRKNHGPKRKLFHDYDSTTRFHFGGTGVLSKYSNYESFALSCAARGAKSGVQDMWNEFKVLDRKAQDEYLANIKENSIGATKRAEAKRKAKEKPAQKTSK